LGTGPGLSLVPDRGTVRCLGTCSAESLGSTPVGVQIADSVRKVISDPWGYGRAQIIRFGVLRLPSRGASRPTHSFLWGLHKGAVCKTVGYYANGMRKTFRIRRMRKSRRLRCAPPLARLLRRACLRRPARRTPGHTHAASAIIRLIRGTCRLTSSAPAGNCEPHWRCSARTASPPSRRSQGGLATCVRRALTHPAIPSRKIPGTRPGVPGCRSVLIRSGRPSLHQCDNDTATRERTSRYEHDHHQGRHGDLLQGLGVPRRPGRGEHDCISAITTPLPRKDVPL
jgi:hypothetical protein